MNYTKLQDDLVHVVGVSIHRIEKQLRSDVVEIPSMKDIEEFEKRYQGRTDLKPYEVELNIFKMTIDGIVHCILAAVKENNKDLENVIVDLFNTSMKLCACPDKEVVSEMRELMLKVRK